MIPGTVVRFTRAARERMRWAHTHYGNGSQSADYPMRWIVREFGRCIGVILGPVDYNNCKPGDPEYDPSKIGPELDVRWQPSGLRYGYDPSDLEIVSGGGGG